MTCCNPDRSPRFVKAMPNMHGWVSTTMTNLDRMHLTAPNSNIHETSKTYGKTCSPTCIAKKRTSFSLSQSTRMLVGKSLG